MSEFKYSDSRREMFSHLIVWIILLSAGVCNAQGPTFTNLYSFTANGVSGGYVLGQPVVDASGNVCGTASAGGPSGFYGTVWEFSGGVLSVVHSFEYTDGANPFAGLAVGKHGEFVGTAEKGRVKPIEDSPGRLARQFSNYPCQHN